MIKYGMLFDTKDRRGDRGGYFSSFGSYMHHDHHPYYPYRRSDMGYLLYEFNKLKPPTFDEETKTSQDAEASLLGMKKLFRCMTIQKI